MPTGKKLKIGITIAAGADTEGLLWSSAAAQNVVLLAMTLQRLPRVEAVYLVPVPDCLPHPIAETFGLPVAELAPALDVLDVIIETDARIGQDEPLSRFRARGGKLVSFATANRMLGNLQEIAHGLSRGDSLPAHGYDMAWVRPQHWHMSHSYVRMLVCPHIAKAPVIWDPVFARHRATVTRRIPFWRAPEDGKFTIGCFDANNDVTKTFHFPLMVAECAFRKQPEGINRLLLFNGLQLGTAEHLTELAAAFDIGQAPGKLSLEGRHPLIDMLGTEVHAVVTHQWEDDVSHSNFETLYFGWPLVHNSTTLREVGYYYPPFDPIAGGASLLRAMKDHRACHAAQAEALRDVFWSVSPDNPQVQSEYDRLLVEVLERQGSAVA